MVLVGPSGCGKTTLLHVIAGISRADAGEIRVDGVDIAPPVGSRPRPLPGGQDRLRLPDVQSVARLHGAGKRAAGDDLRPAPQGCPARRSDLLDRVGLECPRRRTSRPALSVGEQQRVAVARALANRPVLMLADEPTANVDQAHQQQIIDLIRQTCREENVALVLVTHTPEVAAQFDRVDRLADINHLGKPRMNLFTIAWRSIQQRGLGLRPDVVVHGVGRDAGRGRAVDPRRGRRFVPQQCQPGLQPDRRRQGRQAAADAEHGLLPEPAGREHPLRLLPGVPVRRAAAAGRGGTRRRWTCTATASSRLPPPSPSPSAWAISTAASARWAPPRNSSRRLRSAPPRTGSSNSPQGRNFQRKSPEHGYWEAVVGSVAARELNLHVGDRISPTHGDPELGDPSRRGLHGGRDPEAVRHAQRPRRVREHRRLLLDEQPCETRR